MKTVNFGEKYEKTIQVRLTQEQFDFLGELSQILGVTSSEYVRMLITSNIVAYRRTLKDEGKDSDLNN